MTYTNPRNNNIVCTFKIDVYFILIRVKFTRSKISAKESLYKVL